MKTTYIYGLIFLSVICLFLQSCDWECVEGNGIIITEQRLVTEFTGVENETSFEVEIVGDTVFSVDVTADENILPMISTYVRGDNLIIDSDYNMCFNSSGYVLVEIHMPVIDKIELNGSGDIDVYNFDCGYLEIENSGSGNIDMINIYSGSTIDIRVDGSGDVSISGKAMRGDYTLGGSGNIYARDLFVNDCYAVNSGSGNIQCFAYDLLDAIINGSGDIIYSGSPDEVQIDDNGSGEVRGVN